MGGRAVLDEEVIDGMDAATERILNWKHCPVYQKLGKGLERVLKLLTGHRVGVRECCQNRTL